MNLKKVSAKVLSVVMALAMMMAVCAPFASALAFEGNEKDELNYVALGASNTNGFGLMGYLPEELYNNPVNKFEGSVYGYLMEPEKAYPALVANALAEMTGKKVDLHQLAISSMRAEELQVLLDNDFYGDVYTEWRFTGGQEWFLNAHKDGLDGLRKEYQDYVANADVITVDIGANNFGVFSSNRIFQNMYKDIDFSRFDEGTQRDIEKVRAEIANIVNSYLADSLTEELNDMVDLMVETFTYAVVGFCVSFDASMERIYELNPDATVVVVNIQNLMYGLEATLPGSDVVFPMGDMFGEIIDLANLYTASLSPYADQYYYAYIGEDGQAETFLKDLQEYTGNPKDLRKAVTDCFDVYDNDIYAKTRVLQELVKHIYTKVDPSLITIRGPFAEKYNVAGLMDLETFGDAVYDNAIVLGGVSIADFLAYGEQGLLPDTHQSYYNMYKASLLTVYDTAATFMQLGANSTVMDIASAAANFATAGKDVVQQFFAMLVESIANPGLKIEETAEFQALANDPAAMAIITLGVRSDIGNSFLSHPNENGHVEIKDAIISAIENETSGNEAFTVNKAMDALKFAMYLITEYYDDAYEYGYAEAVKLGYIEDINNALDAALVALDDVEEWAYANEKYVRSEELLSDVSDTVYAAKVAIEEIRTLVNEGDKLDDETFGNLSVALDALYEAVCELSDVVRIVTDDAAEYLKAEAEKQLAILRAELEVAVGEAKVKIEAEIARIEAQLKADLEALEAQVNKQLQILNDAVVEAIEDAKATLECIVENADDFLREVAGEAYDKFVELVVYLFDEYAHDGAVYVYYWLYNNPETVIGFFNEYGDEMVDFIVDNEETIVGVLGFIAYNYGEDIACYVIENADVIFPAIAKWFDIHGEYAWDLVKVYLEALGVDIIPADELLELVGDLALVVKELGIEALEELFGREFASLEEVVDYVADLTGEKLAELETLIEAATNHYYTRTENSFIAAIGGQGYAGLVAGALNVGFEALEGLRASDIIDILDTTYENDAYGNALIANNADLAAKYLEAVKKADLITLDLGEADLVGFVANQVTGMLLDTYAPVVEFFVTNGLLAAAPAVEAYEMDWTRFADFITAEDVEEVKAAVKAALVEAGLPETYTYNLEINQEIGGKPFVATYPVDLYPVDFAMYAVECYLYATANYAYNYVAAIEAIHAVNPDAQVLVIGAINPFQSLDLVVEGVNVGEILAQFATAMDAQAFACALALPNTTFVSVKDAETALDVNSIIDVENFKVNADAFGATEAGNAYIAEQILAALTVDCAHAYDNDCDAICNICNAERTVADHVYDNKCDADCNVCGATREVGAHTFGEWTTVTEPTTEAEGLKERVCTECGFKETDTIAKLDKPADPVDPKPEPQPEPKPEPQPEPEPEGLAAGAVVAIVISSTLVAGLGGFAIFWFAVKKKSFADLVAVFKK